MNHQHSSSVNFFVLGDSHIKFIRESVSTSSYDLVTKSVPGLTWIDKYDQGLSVYALISLPEIQSSLSQASAVLFLVGTNSVRIIPAREIISQIQQIILDVQKTYPHLNQPEKITIVSTFPCLKTTRRFPTTTSLVSNIHSYNEKLKLLSTQMNFSTIYFHLTNNHLADDNMHIQSRFHGHIFNSIINHFDRLIQTSFPSLPPPPPPTSPSSSPTTTTASNIISTSTSDKEKTPQSSHRSPEALQRRNKQRHQKRKLKQQHTIARKIYHQWTVPQIKQCLQSLNIRYGHMPYIFRNILKLQFNNQHDQDFADTKLEIGIFSENHYKEFIANQPS